MNQLSTFHWHSRWTTRKDDQTQLSTNKVMHKLLLLSSLLILSCSVPEDKLWEKRIPDAASLQGETTYVAALDLDLQGFVDSLDPQLLQHRAERDFPIFAHNTPKAIVADSASFVKDSILPRLVMEDVQELLRSKLETMPFLKAGQRWSLDPSALRESMHKKAAAALGDSNQVDSLMGVALGTPEVGITKAPIAAILLRKGRTYWWTMITCWSDPLDSLGFAHYDAAIYDAKKGQEIGRFYGSWGK